MKLDNMSSNIQKIIKEKRKKLDLSQEEFANKMKVSINYISLLENGKKSPGKAFLRDFSDNFNIPMLLLLDENKLPKGKTQKEKKLLSRLQELKGDLEKLFLKSDY